MKVTWEAQDIKPGRWYSKPDISEKWIIGYLPNAPVEKRFVSVSAQDGMVTHTSTSEELAEQLTSGGYYPMELL